MTKLGGDLTISVRADAKGIKKFFAKTATEPKLVTIPNVEIMEVGEDWPLASGPQTFTEDDLLKVIEAINSDSAVHAPRLKVGHADGRLDGEPAFGKFINIRLINNNQTLVGDLAGVPEWLAKIMPTAYANRSVEGKLDFTTATGKKWPLVLTAVSLLGVEMPGISTLEDLRDYYGEEMPEGTVITDTIAAGLAEEIKDPDEGILVLASHVRATVDIEDLRRSFYETIAAPGTDHYWWWIRCVQIDPQQVIVEDEDAGVLYRIPYSTTGNDVVWSDPVAVEIHYVDIATPVAASAAATSTYYASAADSRPAERSTMDPKQLRVTLGLAEDASDAEVSAALTELKARPAVSESGGEGGTGEPAPEGEPNPTPEGEPAPPGTTASAAPAIPEGMVLVDSDALKGIQAGAQRADTLWKKQEEQERDTTIKAAVAEGKFGRARIEHWSKAWDADPEGTKALLASLAPGLVPVEEIGAQGGPEGEAGTGEAYPAEWLSPQERRIVEANAAGTLGAGPGTITTERVGT